MRARGESSYAAGREKRWGGGRRRRREAIFASFYDPPILPPSLFSRSHSRHRIYRKRENKDKHRHLCAQLFLKSFFGPSMILPDFLGDLSASPFLLPPPAHCAFRAARDGRGGGGRRVGAVGMGPSRGIYHFTPVVWKGASVDIQ